TRGCVILERPDLVRQLVENHGAKDTTARGTALALHPSQLVQVREFVTSMRAKKPIAIIDAYYDADGQALCPMVTGISHHVSPYGDIEPCPVLQFGKETIRDQRGIVETFNSSTFLKDFREISGKATRGCVILERPDLVRQLVENHGAKDTTARGTALAIPRPAEPPSRNSMP
ncbi:MAG: hypothetical protein RI897_4297, partial [Verrucomicrobiota bacterium]